MDVLLEVLLRRQWPCVRSDLYAVIAFNNLLALPTHHHNMNHCFAIGFAHTLLIPFASLRAFLFLTILQISQQMARLCLSNDAGLDQR